MTGKQFNVSENRKQLQAIEQMFHLFDSMPDDFPRAINQSPVAGGYIVFLASRENIRKITEHYGRNDWRRSFQGKTGGQIVVEWIKVLPNGVRISIENAETVSDTMLIFGQTIDPLEYEAEAEMFIGS